MDQPGKVANPARGQLNKENNIPLSPCVPENLVSRDGFGRPVPRQPAHLHTQAESGTVRNNRKYHSHLNRYQINCIIPFPFQSNYIIPFPSKKLPRKYCNFRDISIQW